MRVRAIERGFDNLCIREPGEEFDMPEGTKPAPWFEPVDKKADKAKPFPQNGHNDLG